VGGVAIHRARSIGEVVVASGSRYSSELSLGDLVQKRRIEKQKVE
jgi:hypothetical protein